MIPARNVGTPCGLDIDVSGNGRATDDLPIRCLIRLRILWFMPWPKRSIHFYAFYSRRPKRNGSMEFRMVFFDFVLYGLAMGSSSLKSNQKCTIAP